MKKLIENREFNALEIIKMYDDDSILCDLITENEGEELKREQNIGFVKEVWQEFVSFTDVEIKELKGIRDESYTLVE